MVLQEQNWKYFWANHLEDWHGLYAQYSTDGEVIKSFQGFRRFLGNPERTEIFQTNRYTYADGKTEEHSWEFNRQSNSLQDGFFHPARPLMRGLCFEQGAAIWVTLQLQSSSHFGAELFFKYK